MNGGWAVFLPAISFYYTQQLSKLDANPDVYGVGRWPAGLPKGHDGLDFLKKDSYFYYKWGLYSAGHAKMDLAKSDVQESMVQKRDKTDNILIGDSGGYQIATGQIKMDWQNLHGPAWDKIRMDILRWLEHTADWSMTLDVPAFAAEMPLSLKTGLTKFRDTLDISLENLDFFMKNRVPGATKFLNVLSGSSVENSREWYDAVKHFSSPAFVGEAYGNKDLAFEGYAFAGVNMKNMTATLERMVDLIEEDLISDKDWIHFLGTSRLDWACYLTSIQRNLRKHHNPNITVSFDCASPFLANAKGLIYTYNQFGTERVGYTMDKAYDNHMYAGSKLKMPFGGPIMSNVTVGDLCKHTDEKDHPLYKEERDPRVNPDADPEKKNPKTSWDGVSYLLMMAHNTYNHITAVQEVNRLLDLELVRGPLDFATWTKEKKTSSAGKINPHIPINILYFDSFVSHLLDPNTKNRHELIAKNKSFLDTISFGGTKANMFSSLFGDAEPDSNDVDSFDENDEFNDFKDR
jgi:hypothetical protein